VGSRPGQRADTTEPPLGEGGAEGGVPDDGGNVDPGFGNDPATQEEATELLIDMQHASNAALGGAAAPLPTIDKESKRDKHMRVQEARDKRRSKPKKGRMVAGGKQGRKVN